MAITSKMSSKKPGPPYVMVECASKAEKERFRRAAVKAKVPMAELARSLFKRHCDKERVR